MFDKKHGRRYNLQLLFLGSVAMFTIVILSIEFHQHQVTDSFYFRSIGYLNEQMDSGTLFPVPEDSSYSGYYLDAHPGFEMMLAGFIYVTGIDADEVQFIPVGMFLLPLFAFCVTRRVAGNSGIALLISLYITLQVAQSPTLGSTFAHMWGYSLFMAAILIHLSAKKPISNSEVVTIMVLFSGAHFVYYISELWLVVFLVTLTVFRILRRSVHSEQKHGAYLAIALVIAFFGFNSLIYETFIPLASDSSNGNITFLVYRYFGRWLGDVPSDETIWTGDASGLYTLVTVALVLVIAVPFMINLVKSLTSTKLVRQSSTTVAVGATVATDITLYPILGPSLQLRTLLHFSPLVNHTKWSRRTLLSAAALVGFSSISLALVLQGGVVYYPSSEETVEPGTFWLMDHRADNPEVLSDFRTLGFVMVLASEDGWLFQDRYFTSSTYRWLISVGNDSSPSEEVIVIVNTIQANLPTPSTGWTYYAPLEDFEHAILDNSQLRSVYDDGQLCILISGQT